MKKILLAALAFLALDAYAQRSEITILAHRGGCGEGIENVLPTFQKSLDAGIRAFELDVRITKDGKIVLQHDDTLKRTSGVDKHVEDMTEKELRAVTLNDGSKLAFLDEVLALFAKYDGIFVEFEMKSSKYSDEFLYGTGYMDKIVKPALKSKPKNSTYCFTSFDTRPLRYIREHYPATETAFITSKGLTEETIAVAVAIGATRMAARIDRTSRKMMELAHKHGLLVNLWPGRSDDSLLLAWSLGADIHCTDYPVHLTQYGKEHCKWLTIK